MQERSSRRQIDHILLTLESQEIMARGQLRQLSGVRQVDLGIILDELEEEGKIKRRRLRNGRHGAPSELISLVQSR